MELLKILTVESLSKALIVFAACIAAGVSEGVILILMINMVVSGNFTFSYLAILPVIAFIFIISVYLYYKKGTILAEKAMKKRVISLCNDIRLSEFSEVEKMDKSENYNQIWNSRNISEAILLSLTIFHKISLIIFVWIYASLTSILLCLFITCYFFLVIMVYEVFQKIIKSEENKGNKVMQALFKALDNILYGFKEVRLNRFKKEYILKNHITPLIDTRKKNRIYNTLIASEFFRFINFSFLCGISLCALTLSETFANGITLTLIIVYLRESITMIPIGLPQVTAGNAIISRLSKTEKKFRESKRIMTAKFPIFADFKSILFENISFIYAADENFSLGPVNFEIKKGEILFITGGNGSGKSTLVKIICGLYMQDSGNIFIDGKRVDMRKHKYLFTAIFADFHLFDSLYGVESIASSNVNELLNRFELSHKTELKEKSFTTSDLSTGQRKRLAFIAGMLEDRQIYIFDEWAADQDPKFRKYFYEKLLPSLKASGKTVIAVTHDDHYFHTADRVIKIEYGKII
jgi:putative pyoverdin transport system ATP-binding/permease protein